MEYNYTFLVIEDNVIDQIVTRQILKRSFIASEIYVVNDGYEGLCWLKTYKSQLNQSLIILSDIEMPIMDGIKFLSNYDKLSHELKKDTRIFMLSSTLCLDKINQGQCNPYVEDVFTKPLPIEKFMAMICPPLKHQA